MGNTWDRRPLGVRQERKQGCAGTRTEAGCGVGGEAGCTASPSPSRRKIGKAHDGQEGRRRLALLLPLVRRLALKLHRRLPPHIELDELVGAGALGLVEAMRRYDGRRQVDIEHYASHRIRGAMLDALRAWDPMSRETRRKVKRIEEAAAQIESRLGRQASDVEISAAVGLSGERWGRTVRDLRALGYEANQPGQVWGAHEPVDENSLMADPRSSPFALCYQREQRALLQRAMGGLKERERRLLRLYYQKGWTMKQIGRHLGLDESRISQLHSASVQRLKSAVLTMMRNPPPALSGTATLLGSAPLPMA